MDISRQEQGSTDSIDYQLEAKVGDSLRNLGKTLATAESCTGGLVGHRLTQVPGASDYYLGGIIAYHNEIKVDLLGVSKEILESYGTVSEETAREMAKGARLALNADYSISITGIAGPNGEPVGLMWISVNAEDINIVERFVFEGNREENKAEAVQTALLLLLRVLEN